MSLTQQQAWKLLDEEARKLTKYREDRDRGLVIVVFEGFDLFEISISYFKNARDFRDYPDIAESTLRTWGGKFK
jgi:hypothetical protein